MGKKPNEMEGHFMELKVKEVGQFENLMVQFQTLSTLPREQVLSECARISRRSEGKHYRRSFLKNKMPQIMYLATFLQNFF